MWKVAYRIIKKQQIDKKHTTTIATILMSMYNQNQTTIYS